jgi:hypothetical protein
MPREPMTFCWNERHRSRQLGPGTWAQAPAGASPGWPENTSSNPAVEIAIY